MCDDAENLAGAGTDVRRCSDALGPRKNFIGMHLISVYIMGVHLMRVSHRHASRRRVSHGRAFHRRASQDAAVLYLRPLMVLA